MTSRLQGISGWLIAAAATLFASSVALAAVPAELVQTVCTSCHKLEVVTSKEKTQDEWRAVVKAMVEKGAPLKPEEAGAVTEYLAAKYGKHDRAKELVESVCILCHEFARISSEALTRDQWAGEIKGMLDEGAPLNNEEFAMVVDYLTEHYGPKKDPKEDK